MQVECQRPRGWRVRVAVGLVAVGTVAYGGAARAQQPPAAKGREPATRAVDPAEFGEKLAQHLDLTQVQKKKIQQITVSFRTRNADALARAEKVQQEVLATSQDGTRPTREEIKAIADKHGNPAMQLMPALQQLSQDVTAVLTPEQRRRLDELRQQFRQRGGERRGKVQPG